MRMLRKLRELIENKKSLSKLRLERVQMNRWESRVKKIFFFFKQKTAYEITV